MALRTSPSEMLPKSSSMLSTPPLLSLKRLPSLKTLATKGANHFSYIRRKLYDAFDPVGNLFDPQMAGTEVGVRIDDLEYGLASQGGCGGNGAA